MFALLAGGALFCPAFNSSGASCSPPPAGIVSWWTGDINAADGVGTNNGTLVGTASAGAAGMVAGSFSFDGTNGSVQIPDSPLLKPTNLTIEAWVRFSNLNSAGSGGSPAGDQYIVFKQNTRGSDFEGYDLSKTRAGTNDVFRFLVSSSTGANAEIHSATTISTGVWYHVAAVRGSNFTQIFVNGQLERQTNVSFAQDYGTLPVFFGTSGNSSWDHKFSGNLDEVGFFNRALGSNEIAAIFTAGVAGKCKTVTILSQPQSQTVALGSNAVFTVTATGIAPLSYRWAFNGTNLANATSASLTVTNSQPTNSGNYTVVVSNSLGAVTSSVATLTVLVPPAITGQPQSVTNVAGTTANFSATATGTPSPSYQWQFNGVNLSGATASSLAVPNVQPANAGNYTVVASNSVGVVTSSVAVLTVWVPPAISTQPASQTNVTGTTVTFSVTATGTPSPGYQWQFNGSAVSGATGTILSLANIQTSDAGNYTVVVSNGAGSLTSVVAVLTVWVPPAISAQPASRTNVSGTTANFSVLATGAPSPGYQWQFNGATIPGATGSSFNVNSVQPSDGGNYTVVVSNAVTSVTSAVAVLTVWVAPAITVPPLRQTNVVGTAANFNVTATGTPAPGYQWQFNGIAIASATASTLSITNVQTTNGGNYSVVATNSAGSVTSSVAVLTVWVPPAIATQPPSQTNISGTTANLSVVATGTPSPAYQWQFNGATIPGATGSSLTLTNVQPANGGNYNVVATNAAGSATSAVAVLTIWVAPSIAVQPASQTNVTGTTASFNVTAGGTPTPGYQWQFNGAPIASATDSALSVSNVQTNNGGNYSVVVTNSAGASTSSVAVLTVWVPPAITTQPLSRTNVSGTTAIFNVLVSGVPAPGYQWQFNGAAIPGATSSSLNLPNVQPTNGGSYNVVVSNAAGSVTSAVAVLTIWVAPTISAQPLSQTNVTGATANFNVTASGTPAPGYLWQFNGAAIAGATDSALSLSNVQTNNGGNYAVVLTNSAGAITSAVAVLTVWVPPAIATQPLSQTNVSGTTATFSVLATGIPAPGYQWQFNSSPISGATASSLNVSNVQPTNGGNYSVVVTNAAGSTTSTVAALTIWVAPAISAQPLSQTNVTGTTANFSITASGTPAPAYQWQFNGTPIGGATDSALSILNAQTNNAGNYTVVLTNSAGSITSAMAALTIWVPPSITAQPQSQTNAAGNNATLSAAATGIPSPIYQWQFFGTNLAGATSSSLTLTNLQPANGGNYAVVASNSAGSATSSVAVLTITVQLVIVAQPQSRTNILGENASFSIIATGAPPPSVQWQFNGAPISGASSSNLTVVSVQPSNEGNYTVVLTNLAGAATSAVATLTVWVPPSVTAQPQSQTNVAGTDATFSVGVSGKPAAGFQWRFNGTDLPGATSSTLVVASVQTNNAGNYSVLVTNGAGQTNSLSATLTVLIPVPFCDINLEDVVRVELHKPLGTLTRDDLARLTSLTANDAHISSLCGLEWATNLTNFYAGGNLLSDISVLTNLTRLNSLFLQRNFITDISPLASLTNLAFLELRNNAGITSFNPLAGLVNLTSLNVGGNSISNLAFLASLGQLSFLGLDHSQVTDTTVPPALPGLNGVDLSYNPITSLGPVVAFGATNLTSLYLSGTAISNTASLQNFPAITNLVLCASRATSLTVPAALSGLTSLNLGGNPGLISYPDFSVLTNLSCLWLYGNAINDASVVSNALSLTMLDLDNNALTTTALLSALKRLNFLNLENNLITSFTGLSGLTNLVGLGLGGNKGANLNALASLRRLNYLSFSGNAVSTLQSLSSLTNLLTLDASFNPITNYTGISLLTNLLTLSVSSNNISNASFLSGLTQLGSLDARANRIGSMPSFAVLTNLSALRLSSNLVSDASALASLPGLAILDLGGNPLTAWNFLTGLTNLSELYVNGVSNIDLNSLQPLSQLAVLDVSQTGVTNLSGVLPLNRLHKLYAPLNRLKSLSGLTPLPRLWETDLRTNLLDVTTNSANISDIQTLVSNKVTVTYVPQNQPPTITIQNYWPIANTGSSVINFSVSDDVTPANLLLIAYSSSNPSLIGSGNMVLGGTNGTRTLTVTPIPNAPTNTTTITVSATDDTGLTSAANIQVVSVQPTPVPIPDTNLLTLIRTALDRPTGQLSNLDLLLLNQLYADNQNISNLSGLEYASNLVVLSLASNRVTSLTPILGLPNLTSLTLDNNPLTNLQSVASLTKLTTLQLNNLGLTNLSFLHGLTNLLTLTLITNRLADLSVLEGLPALSYVNLIWNVLNTNSGSAAMAVIGDLTGRGATVFTLPQIPPPAITPPVSWLIPKNALSITPFSIFQFASTTGALTVTASSSDPVLFPPGTLLPGQDSNGNWVLKVLTPAFQGSATVTLTATDIYGLTGQANILVAVGITQVVNGQGVNQPGLAWSSWGDEAWYNETLITHDGMIAAQSGPIIDNRQTMLGATFVGPGRLGFWWKVSSETNYDFLEFYINGTLQNRISGEVGWQQILANVPPGTNSVYWRYEKDANTSMGLDAGWLDEVTFTSGVWLEAAGPFQNGQARLLLHGVPGHQYEVQVSSNLVNWTQLILITPTNTSTLIIDSTATGTRFYRLHEITVGTIWFEQPDARAGAIRLALHSPKNVRLELQTSSDFKSWLALATVTNAAGVTRFTNSLITNTPRGFYRAKLVL